jgi:hypothetical protein
MRPARSLALWTTLAAMLAGLAIVPAAAQEDAPAVRVARLIPLLGSHSYAERRLATEELEKLGPLAREALQQQADSADPEIRRRAGELLGKLHVADLWEPSRVTVQCRQESAKKVLEQLAGQSGNRVAPEDGTYAMHEAPVTLAATSAPFWSVLDDLCLQSGNYVRPYYDHRRPGFVVVAGRFGKFPMAYAGPIRGRVTGARRMFTEELDHEKGTSEVTHNFQLTLQFTWEDRFRPVAFRSQAELVEAITDTGVRVTTNGVACPDWEAAADSSRMVTTALSLRPPPTAAKQLDVLRVRWGLFAVGDMATLDVRELAAGRSFTQDDLRLTVLEYEKIGASRYRIVLLVNRDLALPEPRSVAFHENEFDLYDAQDQPLRKMVNSWRFTDEGLRIQATFTQPGEGGQPAALRFSYPRIRSQRALDILFRDVPLPTARPE